MRLRILGGLELTSLSGVSVGATRQTRLMLACLALAGVKGLTRADLCSMFWPSRPAAQARNSLRQGLAVIRKALSADGDAISLEGDLETVRLKAGPETVDVLAFREALLNDNRDGWIAAAHAYQGDLLAGVEGAGEAEQFLASHRRALCEQAQIIAERLSKAATVDGEALDAAQALAERLLQKDPTSEEAHRALMRCFSRRGRTNAAVRQFEKCKETLRQEFQAEPDSETRRLFAAIRLAEGNELDNEYKFEARIQDVTAEPSNPLSRHPSVAVMPFDNLGSASDEYFADGVVEEVTSALSRIRDFFVIARQSTFTFKGRFVDVQEVGRALGVAYVVEGTVRRGDDRLRISVQLVDVTTRAQLWSDRYEGAANELFEFQDRIAEQVAGALKPAIRKAEIEAARRKPPASLEAYDLVMRAFPKLCGQNAAAIDEAIPMLMSALRIDPVYGRAHALLAWCHALRVTYLWVTEIESEVGNAQRAIDAAASLIDDDPTAMTAAGAAIGFCGDQEGASALIERALALDPNNAWGWARWGWVGIYRGQPDRAHGRFEKAMKLSPLDPFAFNTRMGMASALVRLGNLDEAVAIAKDVTKTHSDVTWAHRLLASWAAMAGDLPTARRAARKLMAANPEFTIRRYLAVPTFQDMPEYRDRLAQGLRDAGLPEG